MIPETAVDTKANFIRLLGYVKDRKAGLFAAIVGMIGYAAADSAFVYSLKPLLDEGLTGIDPNVLTYMPLFVMGVVLFRGLCNFLSTYCMSWVGTHVVMTMRRQIFGHLMSMPVSFFDKNSTGMLLSKITYDTSQVSAAATSTLVTLVRQGATLIGLMALMFYHSWQLSTVLLVVAPVLAYVITVVSRRFRKLAKNMQNAMGSVTTTSEQMLNGHREVLAFNGQSKEQDRFNSVSNSIRRQQMKMSAAKATSSPVVQIIASMGLAVVLYVATFPEIMDSLTPGSFTLVITSMMMMQGPLKSITQVNEQFQRGMAACSSLFTILDTNGEVDSGERHVDRVMGALEFDKVSFTYPTKDEPVLRDVSFAVEPGKTVALVGRSGSGKSTIASLLPRFYDIEQGCIRIDGVDAKEYHLSDLRRQFSIVSQNVHLFAGSIADNIGYADDVASREDIVRAAEMANVMEFASDLPLGLDTLIGERGVMLSGGQRQRVAIARALLRNAPILVLDEATSALDTASERKIQDAIDVVCKDRTALVIAHRLSTIEKADEIIVVDDGRLVERGTHLELLAKQGVYYQLHQLQFGSEQ
jgi:subfamily B ATP-binding cassette protein MsbA